MFKKMLNIMAMCTLTGFVAAPALSYAAEYPSRPITIIVPFGAGGESDIVARLLADNMSKVLGQNVAVQNIVGASGVTGMNSIATAKADGYTLGFSPSAPLAIHPHMRKVPYSIESFSLIGRAVNAPYFLMAQKSSPWNDANDMAKDMGANPDKYFWASAGVGSVPHIAILNMLGKYGVKAKHVSFSGDADAFQALAGDRAQLYASTSGTLHKFDVKPLAIMSENRDPAWPNVPTFKELGKEGIITSQWMAFIGPKGLPENILETLSAAMEKSCASPEFIDSLNKLGLTPSYLNSVDTAAFLQQESCRNAELIKALAEHQK